jgi:hypothetical protein
MLAWHNLSSSSTSGVGCWSGKPKTTVSDARRRRLGVALGACVLAPVVAFAEGTSSVRVETGADWDTNATREEAGGAADGLLRTVGELQGSTPWGSGARITAGWHGGGKLHMQRHGEDVLHQKADLSLAQALGGVLVLRWDAGARDRTSRAPVQSMDHTRLTTGPGVEARYAGFRVGLRGLYDRTVFKPDPDFDADALTETPFRVQRVHAFDALRWDVPTHAFSPTFAAAGTAPVGEWGFRMRLSMVMEPGSVLLDYRDDPRFAGDPRLNWGPFGRDDAAP